MAERRSTRSRKGKGASDSGAADDEQPQPTSEQFKVAKYLRFNCATKQTLLDGKGKVDFFTASKAIDKLLDSKFARGSKAIFHDRESVVHYLDALLREQFFVRGEKIQVERTSRAASKKADADDGGERPSESEEGSPQADSQKKKKKKIRLDVHPSQRFVDGSDVYAWLYEPTSLTTILLGTVVVVGAIGVCLFPLWPPVVRQGVYYVAVTLACLIGLLFFVAVFRYLPFACAWLGTRGRLHFWMLPNLTEDVGFFESFQPLYDIQWVKKAGDDDERKTDGDDDDEEEPLVPDADDIPPLENYSGDEEQAKKDTDDFELVESAN